MKISVIIPTINRSTDLAKCLDSLLRQSLPPDEIIVVDASTDRQTEMLVTGLKHPSSIALHYLAAGAHLTKQRNEGVTASSGEFLYFFDDDVVLEADCLKHMQLVFARMAEVGGVMARITNINATRPRWERYFKKIFFLSDFGLGRIKPSGLPSHNINAQHGFVTCLTGCCMAYRREVFRDQSFDERLTTYAYMEDVDFSCRVNKRFQLYYEPAARLQHFPSTYRTADSRQLRRMFIRNHRYLFHKNMPHDPLHLYAFWMSIIGTLFYNGILLHDFAACRGILEGLKDPFPG